MYKIIIIAILSLIIGVVVGEKYGVKPVEINGIVRDTIKIDTWRSNKWYQHEYQIEAFHDVDDETDSLAVYSGETLIGIIPVGDHGVDSVITADNL